MTLKHPISDQMNTIKTFSKESQTGVEGDHPDSEFYTNKDKWMCEFHMPEEPVLIY